MDERVSGRRSAANSLVDRIQPLAASARDGVVELFSAVHGVGVKEFAARWEWQYQRNPRGGTAAATMWSVTLDGGFAGVVGASPARLKLFEREVLAYWVSDLMVHPAHQGRGIGTALFEWCRGLADVTLSLGLTDHATRAGRAAGFMEVTSLHFAYRVLNLERVLAHRGVAPFLRRLLAPARYWCAPIPERPKPPAGFTLRQVSRFDARADQLWETVAPSIGLVVRRYMAYLNWKFAEHPYHSYVLWIAERGDALKGYVVLRR